MSKTNPIVETEKEIQKFWREQKIFEQTLAATKKGPVFNFYDGPPFATGTPHYGHLVASVMKDAVPRYWTMKGYQVERKWGWDCHGLPIENLVEKELGFKSKKDIENFGIAKFNETCRSKVLAYVDEWRRTIERFGRFADMDHAYLTMDLAYMESVWWVFKELYDRGLIYEGYKSMHVCPRCETTLSQQEVSEGYKDIKDLSVIAKFELVDQPNTYVLAWTTTPWTLPGNVALAVGEEIEYQLLQTPDQGQVIVASERVAEVLAGQDFSLIKKIKGAELIGQKYQPLFPYYESDEAKAKLKNSANIYTIVSADFVTTADGTGVVHIAPAFGEEDMLLGQEKDLPLIQNVTLSGHFTDEVKGFAGLSVKPIEDTQATDVKIIKYLADKNLLFAKAKYEHSYPHCWRCDTPLINYATSSWFVAIAKIKEQMIKLAQDINCSPEHIKAGRFGQWLEGARDWSISRQRFWASVMPIWRCACGEQIVFGSVKDLAEASGREITDLHKHIVDEIEVPCPKCDLKMKRVPDVLDTWFDSGSMPYAQKHYPFHNKKEFEQSFPAQFIAEGIDQTRAWFYYLHAIATAIKGSRAFSNVIVNGIVLAEGGKKMSKRLQNYPEPDLIMAEYGADALRYYLLSSPVVAAENLNFSEAGVKEARQKVVMLANNILNFYQLYQNGAPQLPKKIDHILDRWLLAKLNLLIKDVSGAMEKYDLNKAVRPLPEFIDEFSTWWLRRSRERFKSGNEADKAQALAVFRHVLLELAKLLAPFTPFVAEQLYRGVQGEKLSVHLESWPAAGKIDSKTLEQMAQVRKIVEAGLAARAEKGFKIRQPLNQVLVSQTKWGKLSEGFLALLKDELNVKAVAMVASETAVDFDWTITEELKIEALARELVRAINDSRKKSGLTIADKIIVSWQSQGEIARKVLGDAAWLGKLQTDTLAEKFAEIKNDGQELELNGEKVRLAIEKI